MWASFLDFLSEVAASRQELHEDRTGPEQRALLNLARKVDRAWNTTMNRKTWERVDHGPHRPAVRPHRPAVRLPRPLVSQYPPEPFIGKVEGICGGPPCQSFSSAGKRRGLDDPRGQLVHEPMRWVRIIRPRWVALEQVPEVLGYWRWISRELRDLGYSTWTGVLNAADYGVPQVRNRAILLASLDRRAVPPEPTHSKTGHDEMFGAGRARWVSMAEALGWGLTERPAYVVAASSEGSGTHDGGSRQGRWLDRRQSDEAGARAVLLRSPGRSYDGRPRLGVLQGFAADHPWQPPYVAAQIGNAIPPPLAEACLRAVAA